MSKTIKSVKLLYPSLMKADAADKILELHQQVVAKEEERAKCFMQQQKLDKEIAAIKDTLADFRNTYELVYEADKAKEVVKGEAPVIIESNGTIHV